MSKPRIHIYSRKEIMAVPMFCDGPAVRDCFEVTRGPTIPKPWPDLVVYETDHNMAINCVGHPFVLLISGYWPRGSIPNGKLKEIKIALSKARHVLCSSQFLMRKIRARFECKRISALPGGLWGTDHVKYKVNPKRFKPKAHYLQHRKGPLIVMSISLAAEIKWRGVELFLDASKDVLQKHNARIINRAMVRGRGDLMERWESEYGLITHRWRRGDAFNFTRGMGDTGWPKLLRLADLFVHPSTWDAWGCVVADAMFSAVPSIVFQGTGAAEISDKAAKVSPKNPAEIAREVDRLLSMSPVEREQYGNALRVEAMKKNEVHRGDIARILMDIIRGKR